MMTIGGRKPPISLILLCLPIGIFLLQAFPATGIFLMLLAAPLWTGALIYLFAFGLVYDALIGRLPKWLLAIPAATLIGYSILAFNDHKMHDEVAEQLRQEASANSIIIDSVLPNLVFDHDVPADEIKSFLVSYQVNTAYHQRYGEMVRLTYTDKQECRSLNAKNCVRENRATSKPANPINITLDERRSVAAEDLDYTTVLLSREGSTIASFLSVQSRPLSWIPYPIIGCFLNSAHASWDCTGHFVRTRYGEKIDGLAHILSILPRSDT